MALPLSRPAGSQDPPGHWGTALSGWPSAGRVRGEPEVTRVRCGEARSTDQGSQIPGTDQQDVVNDVVRRGDLAVAVMPRDLGLQTNCGPGDPERRKPTSQRPAPCPVRRLSGTPPRSGSSQHVDPRSAPRRPTRQDGVARPRSQLEGWLLARVGVAETATGLALGGSRRPPNACGAQ